MKAQRPSIDYKLGQIETSVREAAADDVRKIIADFKKKVNASYKTLIVNVSSRIGRLSDELCDTTEALQESVAAADERCREAWGAADSARQQAAEVSVALDEVRAALRDLRAQMTEVQARLATRRAW